MRYLFTLMAFLLSCQTTQQSVKLVDGYEPKFKANDCAVLSMKWIKDNKMTSDRTPVKILTVSVKYQKYVVLIDHPKVDGIGAPVLDIKRFDKSWVKCD